MKALLLFLILVAFSHSAILITEIMYHPRQYSDLFQYLEVYNNGTTAVSLTGWEIGAINYTFPTTTIQPNSYLVIASNPQKLLWAYPSLSPAQVLGPFGDGELAESGERVKLVDASKKVVFDVKYGVDGNWPVLPDRMGASLELICYSAADFDHSNLWAASVVPLSGDPHLEWGGSPGTAGRWQACLYEKYPDPMVRFSEVHYNPYKTDWYEEVYEFVELKNNNTVSVDISGWRLASQGGRGPLRYTFPAGTVLTAGQIITVAKNLTALNRVYPGIPGRIFGPYAGELPNQESVVALIDTNGRTVESLKYDTSGSFPRAADALGGDNDTLPYDSPFMAPIPGNAAFFDIPQSFRYKGMSLTRRSWEFETDHGYTWYAAIPSPGRDNLDPDTPLLPVITKSSQSPSKKNIQPGNAVNVSINIRPWRVSGSISGIPAFTSVQMTWWKYDVLAATGGGRTTVNMQFDGSDGFWATIPGQSANSFVRYTYTINWADGRKTIHPEKIDPFRYHSLWWNPEPFPSPHSHDAFHLYIRPNDLQHLIDISSVNIEDRRVERSNRCTVRHAWQRNRNCTFVFEGSVYDSTCRLQGSRWNRPNGDPVNVAQWGGVGPSNGILAAYSYRVNFPAQFQIKKAKSLIIHKMYQGCTFYQTPLLNYLSDQIGVSSSRTEFGRFWLNGRFLRLVMIIIYGGADWVKESKKILEKRCLHQSTEDVGDVFKVHGSPWEGPFGAGNFRSIGTNPNCPQWNQMDVWDATYSRQTYKFADVSQIDTLIRRVNTNGLPAATFNNTVDFNAFLGYFLLDSYGSSWDHSLHNQLVHRRLSDGVWEWLPWDADSMFGERCGRDGWQTNECPLWSNDETAVKEQFWRLFQPQIRSGMQILLATVLKPANLQALLNSIDSDMDLNVFRLSDRFAPFSQNQPGCKTNLGKFFTERATQYRNSIGAFSGTQAQADAALATLACPSKPTLTKVYNQHTSVPGPSLAPLISYVLPSLYVNLTWNRPNPNGFTITTYKVQRQTNGAAWTTVASPMPLNSTILDGFASLPIDLGNNYSFRIIATNSAGDGVPSLPRSLSIPLNCTWSGWSQWSNCSLACGGGISTQTRTKSPAARNGGVDCVGNASQTTPCNTQNCPINCVWTNWSAYSNCSQVCGGGVSVSTRTQNPPAQYGGTPCVGNATDSVPCNTQICIDCAWTAWNWTECSALCGGGQMTATRSQLPGQPGGLPCTGASTDNATCNTQPCPIDCEWSQWTQICSVPCGGGNASQTRYHLVEAQFNGTNCTGPSEEHFPTPCNTQDCLQDCWWENWSDWSDCTTSCGGGTQTQTRDQHPEMPGGIPCTGSGTQSQPCNTDPCPPGSEPVPMPIDCEWDDWGGWGNCHPCDGNGTQTRSRGIRTREQNGGITCFGPDSDLQNCTDCSGNTYGLSTGALVGIIVGAIIGTAVLIGLIALLYFSSLSSSFEQV